MALFGRAIKKSTSLISYTNKAKVLLSKKKKQKCGQTKLAF